MKKIENCYKVEWYVSGATFPSQHGESIITTDKPLAEIGTEEELEEIVLRPLADALAYDRVITWQQKQDVNIKRITKANVYKAGKWYDDPAVQGMWS